MAKMYEGKGKTISNAFAALLEDLTKGGALYKVQVADGDWVVGVKAEGPAEWKESHEWEDDRKLYYRKKVEEYSDLKWEDIKSGRHFYCFRDWPERGFLKGETYYCGCNSVITNRRGSGECFNPIDVPFYFRLATQDEIEKYYIERRKRLDEAEEWRRKLLEYDNDDD